MSLTHGHFHMADRLRSRLGGELGRIIESNQAEYWVGSLGPDILYWAEFVTPARVVGFGLAEPHLGDTGKLTFHLIETAIRRMARNAPHAEACMAFALGWVTHWATDLYIHSLVDKYGGNYLTNTARHAQLELVETKHLHQKLKGSAARPGGFNLRDDAVIRDFVGEAFRAAHIVHGSGYEEGQDPKRLPGFWPSAAGLTAMERAYRAAETGCSNSLRDTVLPAEYAQLAVRMMGVYFAVLNQNLLHSLTSDLGEVSSSLPAFAWASEGAFIPSDQTYERLIDPIDVKVTTSPERIDIRVTLLDTGLYGRFLTDHEYFMLGAVTKGLSVATIVNDYLALLAGQPAPGQSRADTDDWTGLGYRRRLAESLYDYNKGRGAGDPALAPPGGEQTGHAKRSAKEDIFEKFGISLLVPDEWGLRDLIRERFGANVFSRTGIFDPKFYSEAQGISSLVAERYGVNTLIPEGHWCMLSASSAEVGAVLGADEQDYRPGIGRDPAHCEIQICFADRELPPVILAEPFRILGNNALHASQRAEANVSFSFENPDNKPYLYRIKTSLTLREHLMTPKYENIEYKHVTGIHADIAMIRTATAFEVGYRGKISSSRDKPADKDFPLLAPMLPGWVDPTRKLIVDTQDQHQDERTYELSWDGDCFLAKFTEAADNRPIAMPGCPPEPVCGRRTRCVTISGRADFRRNVVTFTGVEEIVDVCHDEERGYERRSSETFSANDVAIIDLDEDGNMIRLGVDTEKDFARSAADYRRISVEKNVYDDESSTEEWTGGKSDVSGKLCLYIEFRR